MNKEAFSNTIDYTIATGGSTDIVLRLFAIAHACKADLTSNDFQKISGIPVNW